MPWVTITIGCIVLFVFLIVELAILIKDTLIAIYKIWRDS